jgi:SAM-dependent methyltransferase
MVPTLSPDAIFDIGCSFWKAKALLSAVELDLFTVLASDGPLDVPSIRNRVGLHERGALDFLDALVALGLLHRDERQRYANSAEADLFLDRRKPTYTGGFLEMCNERLYPAWGRLTQALQTGHSVHDGESPTDWYGRVYASDESRDVFLAGMTGGARPAARRIASQFPWRDVRTVLDVGCAEGCLLTEIVRAHPHVHGVGFDLPPVASSFDRFTRANGVADRVRFQPGDFRADAFPPADVIVFGRVLHNWDLATRKYLLAKAFEALPAGGRVLVYERLIDDDRNTNATALLASLNMLVVTPDGGEFTGRDCALWMREAGFLDPRVEPLAAFHAMVVGAK